MKLQRIAAWLQFDRSLSFALIARVWQAISGPITMALLVLTMTKLEQGIFTGILGIVAIQPLFELGLGSVLIGQAGNVIGRARGQSNSHTLANQLSESVAQGSLPDLARVSSWWFGSIAVLYFIGGGLMGWKVLSGDGIVLIDWRLPLVLAIALAAMTLAISPRVYVLEGGGEREHVYRLRLWQAVAGSLTMWLALLLGLKLWAIVAVFAVGAVFQLVIAYGARAQRLLLRPPGRPTASHRLWIAQIAPLQWRTAAASAAHYLASQLLYIYVLNYHGASEAAPFGLTLQATVAVQALALAWAQTKFPLIARYQAQGERELAGNLWRQTAIVSSGLLLLALCALAIAVSGLPLLLPGWELRFISPGLILVLAVGYLANHLFALQAFYVLSRGAKPFVVASVTGLLCVAVAVWFGGKVYSVPGVIVAFSLSMACIALPLHSWAYLKFRARVNKSSATKQVGEQGSVER